MTVPRPALTVASESERLATERHCERERHPHIQGISQAWTASRAVGSGSVVIAALALRSLVLMVIATLLVLVVLPAALVAAGT